MRIFTLSACALALASSASAQEIRDKVIPPIGTAAVAAVGEPVYEHSHLSVVQGYQISEGFSGKNIFATVTVEAGEKFIAIPSKTALKACHAASFEAFARKQYDACLIDDDGNGTFDRYGANEVQGGKKLPKPLAYTKTDVVQATTDAIKQTVTYLGATKDTLRLSYREFINDMARPAFTEEYSFPIGATFPQKVAFKGVKLNVTAIDGEGIHYEVTAAPSS